MKLSVLLFVFSALDYLMIMTHASMVVVIIDNCVPFKNTRFLHSVFAHKPL